MARARSLTDFQAAFPSEANCAAFLFERRWPGRVVNGMCEAESSASVAKVDDLDPTSSRTVAEYPVFDDAPLAAPLRA